jgi:hypothetical protein
LKSNHSISQMNRLTAQLVLCWLSIIYISGLVIIMCFFHGDEIPASTSSQVITMINYCLLLVISLAGLCFSSINIIKDNQPVPDWVEVFNRFCGRLISMRLICVSIMLGIVDYIDTCIGSSCYQNRPIYLFAISPPHLVMIWIAIKTCLPNNYLNQCWGDSDDHNSLNGENPLEVVGIVNPMIVRPMDHVLIKPIDPTYASLKHCYQRPLATSCSICLSTFSDLDTIIILKCGHFNHNHCLNQWLSTRLNCPMCREVAFTRHMISPSPRDPMPI